MPETGKVMRIGLIVTALIIVVRIVLEQAGAPLGASFVFGVAWLYFIMPVLFAISIRTHGFARPYVRLLREVLLFAIYTRIMVAVTYMLAWYMKWPAARFASSQGGTVGDDVSALDGLLLIPLRNALIWIVMALVVGMIVGSITLALKRRPVQAADLH